MSAPGAACVGTRNEPQAGGSQWVESRTMAEMCNSGPVLWHQSGELNFKSSAGGEGKHFRIQQLGGQIPALPYTA